MKSIIFSCAIISVLIGSSWGDEYSVVPCPTRRFNITDYILPGRNYFLETGYVFNYEVSDASVTDFRLNDIFRPNALSWDIRRRLRAELPETAGSGTGEATSSAADIFYGFLGQSMESSISRSVGGDASLIIGYSSNSAYTPRAIREKVSASLNQNGGTGGVDFTATYVREYLALKASVTPKAERRFGAFQGVIYDSQMRIRGLKFANQTFLKTPGSRGFATEGDRLTIFDFE